MSALDENRRKCRTGFNVAEGVEQILGSVADMNDADNLVVFDKEKSVSMPGSSPEAAMIRRAIEKSQDATKIHRRRNNFYIPLWVQKPSEEQAKAGFTRRGE